MNKSAAGSRNFSHSHSGISASGIGGVGGSLCQLITERVNFVVFLHIAAASPKCTVRYTMVTETQSNAFCFHFLVFYKKHAFSLFCSSIQGLCILCVRHWECGKNPLLNITLEDPFSIFRFVVSRAVTHFSPSKFLHKSRQR